MAIVLGAGACGLSFEVGPFDGGTDGGQTTDGGEGIDGGQDAAADGARPDGGNPDTGPPVTPSVPQYLGSSSADVAGTRNFSIDRPDGTKQGDLLLVTFYGNNSTNTIDAVPATDWQMLDNGIMTNCTSLGMWGYRVVGASDGASYAFTTHDAAGPQTIAIVAYRGVDPTTITSSKKRVNVPNNSTTYGPISVNVDAANSMIVMMAVNDKADLGPSKWTPPAGMTERLDNSILGIFDEPRATVGPSEQRTATATTAEHCGAVVMVALRPLAR